MGLPKALVGSEVRHLLNRPPAMPRLIRRRPIDKDLPTLRIPPRILTAGEYPRLLQPPHLSRTQPDPARVVRDPHDGLRLPRRGVTKRSGVHPARPPIHLAGAVRALDTRGLLACVVVEEPVRARDVLRVDVRELHDAVPPLNPDLAHRRRDDHHGEQDAARDPQRRQPARAVCVTLLQEEEPREAHLGQVERCEERRKRLVVDHPARLQLLGLVHHPQHVVLVRHVEEEQADDGEADDNGLDNCIDDSDAPK
jgi:hypothetical protein